MGGSTRGRWGQGERGGAGEDSDGSEREGGEYYILINVCGIGGEGVCVGGWVGTCMYVCMYGDTDERLAPGAP